MTADDAAVPESDSEREWPDDYQTTTHRGPKEFPVPEGWVLRFVEADGTMWGRYEDAENPSEAGHDSDLDHDVTYEGPDDTAALTLTFEEHGSGFDSEYENIEEFEINGEMVFEVRETDREDLYAAVAEALLRFAQGESVEDLADIDPAGSEETEPEPDPVEQRREDNSSLGDWA